jgi:hypothetical protein
MVSLYRIAALETYSLLWKMSDCSNAHLRKVLTPIAASRLATKE